ncbi:hypothetical protein C7Y66_06365 [Chroococcidiopsis sp. CCALA 051]|nr:ISAs1 family transposase [Chroococcidiopsis sp. CCALA 051]MBE9019233.1 ISAs1 family transposase [Chroococcidiopsidales cyanobacterium LEGE 13417]PSM49922.1 hypothetical protein C7Y66_06365 [Chroococcidiopsis sp. CCALA 051]
MSRHQLVLLELLRLPNQRLPSLSTIRRVMVRVDYQSFTQAFNAWAQEAFAPMPNEQIAIDGKSIKASLSDYDSAYQDFVSVVSAFSVAQGVVLGLESMRNHDTSEIKTVELLLDKLELKGVCFSLDALHTQKNRPAARQ